MEKKCSSVFFQRKNNSLTCTKTKDVPQQQKQQKADTFLDITKQNCDVHKDDDEEEEKEDEEREKKSMKEMNAPVMYLLEALGDYDYCKYLEEVPQLPAVIKTSQQNETKHVAEKRVSKK